MRIGAASVVVSVLLAVVVRMPAHVVAARQGGGCNAHMSLKARKRFRDICGELKMILAES